MVDGCNSHKGREFLHNFPHKFDPVNAKKRISCNLHNGDRLYINSSTCSSSHVSHSKRMPLAPSTKTLSIFGTFLSLCLVVTFLIFLKGREYNKLTKPQQGFSDFLKIYIRSSRVFYGRTSRDDYSTNSPKSPPRKGIC